MRSIERPSRLIYLVPAGASDFPHSKQHVLERGVISPQNGHILADGWPRPAGVSDANRFKTEALTPVCHLRKRSRARCIDASPTTVIMAGTDHLFCATLLTTETFPSCEQYSPAFFPLIERPWRVRRAPLLSFRLSELSQPIRSLSLLILKPIV